MRASCLHNRRIWNYEIKKWIFIADDVREGWWIELGVRLWVMSREVALHCALSFMSDFIECSLCWRSLFIFQSVTQLINLRPFQLPLSSHPRKTIQFYKSHEYWYNLPTRTMIATSFRSSSRLDLIEFPLQLTSMRIASRKAFYDRFIAMKKYIFFMIRNLVKIYFRFSWKQYFL